MEEDSMKLAVIYYSRSNKTRMCSMAISQALNGELMELREEKSRKGFWGYLAAGRDAMTEKETELIDVRYDLSAYDTVIFGSPVWGWTLSPAVRTYVKRCDLRGKTVICFVTMGSSPGKSLDVLENLVKMQGAVFKGSFAVASRGKTDEELAREAKERIKKYLP